MGESPGRPELWIEEHARPRRKWHRETFTCAFRGHVVPAAKVARLRPKESAWLPVLCAWRQNRIQKTAIKTTGSATEKITCWIVSERMGCGYFRGIFFVSSRSASLDRDIGSSGRSTVYFRPSAFNSPRARFFSTVTSLISSLATFCQNSV